MSSFVGDAVKEKSSVDSQNRSDRLAYLPAYFAQLWIVSFLLVGAVLAGDLSLVRMDLALPDLPVRGIFVLLAAAVLLFLKAGPRRLSGCNETGRSVAAPVTLLALLVYGFILANLGYSELTDRTSDLVVEAALIFATLALLGWACWMCGRPIVDRFAAICALFGTMWAVVFLFRIFDEGASQGAIPFATPFTFYRIELLGFFCGLYLAETRPGLRLVCYGLVFVCLTASLSALAKVAWLAVSVSVTVLIFCYWVWFSARLAVRVFAVLAAAAASAFALSGAVLEVRFSHGLIGTGYEILDVGKNLPTVTTSADEAYSREVVTALVDEARNRGVIIAFYSITGRPLSDWEQVDPGLRNEIDVYRARTAILPDLSFRIRLLWHALKGGLEKKWFGQGFAAYRAEAVNLYTREVEVYRYPHNVVAELFYGGGVIGVAIVLLAVFVALGMILMRGTSVRAIMPILCAAFGLFVGSMFGGSITDLLTFWASLILASAGVPSSGDYARAPECE